MSVYSKRAPIERRYDELQDEINEIEKEASRTQNVDIIMCDCLSSMLPEVCAPNHSKQQIDSIVSLCNDYGYRDDLFARRTEIWSELHDMQSEIGPMIEKEIKQIHQKNEELWDLWESRLENIVDNTIKEEKLRLVKNLLDQETTQADKVAEIDGEGLADESNYRWSMKKEFIKEYDLLEELKQENIKALQELNSELPRLSFYHNADLAFKSQEIFSALESEDFDLFRSLVDQDTIDFFYWTIPSKDLTLEKLKNMSADIENMAGDPITVQAMDYLSLIQSYDMNLLITDSGFDRAAGLFGSCWNFVSKIDPYGDYDYNLNQYENVSFVFCPNEYLYDCMDPCEEIETFMQDPYRLEDALYCACVMQDQLWFVFDTSNQKLIGIYDWMWSP
jgi:hypothetical protein